MCEKSDQRIPNDLDSYTRSQLIKYLRRILGSAFSSSSAYGRSFSLSTPPIPAAIIVPILKVEGHWNLLFIRRSISNDPHSGQVAFPGGRMESSDSSPEEASLREAQEEIGLDPQDVEVLGRLPALLTVTNYKIYPVVGMIPYPYPFQPSPDEVQKIFTIPITWLAEPLNYRVEERLLPPPIGTVPTIYYQPYQDEILWGASAQIVHTFITILKSSSLSKKS